jgi:hypothetical protein
LGSSSDFQVVTSFGFTSDVLIASSGTTVRITRRMTFLSSSYQRWPSAHLRLSSTSGEIRIGSTGSSQPPGRKVKIGVSGPLTNTSSVYFPAARSARTRAPLCDPPLPMYDTGMPYAA